MRKFILAAPVLVVVLLVAAALAGEDAAGGRLVLGENSSIEIKEAGPFGTSGGYLSAMLEKHLETALATDDLSKGKNKVVVTIQCEYPGLEAVPAGKLKKLGEIDSFTIEVKDSEILISGKTPMAAGYAVSYFLEEYVGFFWAYPGEDGVCPPKKKTFELEHGVRTVTPDVVVRSMSGMTLADGGAEIPREDRTGMMMRYRHFFMASDFFRSMRLHPGTVHHNMNNVFPVREMERDAPGIFPRNADGTAHVPGMKTNPKGRSLPEPWHPCYSSDKAAEIAIKKGKEDFKKGSMFFSLGINDGKCFYCQCEKCRKAGLTRSYYDFVKKVAVGLKEYYPRHMVGVLAYGKVGLPPADLELPENVLVNVAGFRKEVWDGKPPHMGTYEYLYGAGFVIPNLPLDVMNSNTVFYRRNDLLLYYAEFYPVWAFDAPKAYIVSRKLWDMDGDPYELLKKFCEGAYGEAAEDMYDYYSHAASIRKDEADPGKWVEIWGRVWPFGDPLQFHKCPSGFHEKLFTCLEKAKSKNLTEGEKKRLALVEAFTEFSDVWNSIYELKEKVARGQAGDVKVAEEAAALTKRAKACMKKFESHPEWFFGSSLKIDSFKGREWPVNHLKQELTAAISTVQLEKALQEGRVARNDSPGRRGAYDYALNAVRRDEHPWFNAPEHSPIRVAERVAEGFKFENAPHEIITREEPRHAGKTKAQWLYAVAKELPAGNGEKYKVKIDMKGSKGLLRIMLQGGSGGEGLRKIVFLDSMQVFDNQTSATRKIIIDAADLKPYKIPETRGAEPGEKEERKNLREKKTRRKTEFLVPEAGVLPVILGEEREKKPKTERKRKDKPHGEREKKEPGGRDKKERRERTRGAGGLKLKLYLHWRPDGSDATLAGEVLVSRLLQTKKKQGE